MTTQPIPAEHFPRDESENLALTIVSSSEQEAIPDPFEHPVFDDHELIEKSGVRVGVENVVDGEETEFLWEMYNRGFTGLNSSTLARQSLDKEEFIAELADPTIIKYMARNSEGKPVGFMAVEKGLHREDGSPYWPQQEDELLGAVQAEADPNAPSFYISTFLVDKESDEYMFKTSEIILKGALKHFEEACKELRANCLCFFDFAPPNSFLPDYIKRSGRANSNFPGVEIDIAPVYISEWYELAAENLRDEGSLQVLAEELPDNSFGNSSGILIKDGIPLEIQPENLDDTPDTYVTVQNLPSMDEIADGQLAAFQDVNSGDKKHILINLNRTGGHQDPLPMGKRLGYQTYAVMRLQNDPRQ